jgi:hypothetical protein
MGRASAARPQNEQSAALVSPLVAEGDAADPRAEHQPNPDTEGEPGRDSQLLALLGGLFRYLLHGANLPCAHGLCRSRKGLHAPCQILRRYRDSPGAKKGWPKRSP